MKSRHKSEEKQRDTSFIDGAIAFYEEEICRDPADIDSRAELAAFYGFAGRVTDAVREFTTCLQQDPHHGRALMGFGLFFCIQGNPREGAKKLERAVRFLDPADQLSATGFLGAAYYMSGDLLRAIAYWEMLLDPRMQPLVGFSAHLSLGIAYLQSGRVDRAIHEFTIARSLAEDGSSMARRFPGVALEMGRDQLSLWADSDEAQKVLDLMIPLTWGIYRPGESF